MLQQSMRSGYPSCSPASCLPPSVWLAHRAITGEGVRIEGAPLAAQELSYRIRTATLDDASSLRDISVKTLAHPEGRARREGYRAAAQRGELLVLERYDSRARAWRVCAFVEWHIRVDDVLTIRDIG